jgi:hypothetical protein
VVRPFLGDVERTRGDVLEKEWTPSELRQIKRTPALLLITHDFADFSPRRDPWVVFVFDQRRYGDNVGLAELGDALRTSAGMAVDEDSGLGDLLSLAKRLATDRPPWASVFELKPGVYGASIDVLAAGAIIRSWLTGEPSVGAG